MELTVSGQRRRAAQITRTAPQAEKKTAGANIGTARPKSDKATWSQAALSFLEDLNRQDLEKQRIRMEQKQKGSGELDYLDKALKTMDKCREIASRIMKGDKVPPEDEKFLRDADPDGYKLALACRTPKEKPKEWESVLEDEEGEGSSGSSSDGEIADSSEAVSEA